MRPTRPVLMLAATIVPAASLFVLSGCGDDTPKTGTQASPVDPEVAASQNKAMQEFNKDKMGKTAKKK